MGRRRRCAGASPPLRAPPRVPQLTKRTSKTFSVASPNLATISASRLRLATLTAASANLASAIKRAIITRLGPGSSAATIRSSLARTQAVDSPNVAAASKRVNKAFSVANGNVATINVASRPTVTLSAASVQIATSNRAIKAIRLAVSVNVAVKQRNNVYRTILVSDDNLAALLLVPIRPNFIQPLGSLRVVGGDLHTYTNGDRHGLQTSGSDQRLSSTGRSGTLTTTEP
jgi:hypothetical protein